MIINKQALNENNKQLKKNTKRTKAKTLTYTHTHTHIHPSTQRKQHIYYYRYTQFRAGNNSFDIHARVFLATTVTKLKIYNNNNHNILNKKANETVKQNETTTEKKDTYGNEG